MARVERINVTPVKGLALDHPEWVELTPAGVAANRRFYLTSGGRLYNGKDHGPLVAVRAAYDGERLTLRFPDGAAVAGAIALGDAVETDFWGRPVSGRAVVGPWSEALSDYAGAALRLVQTDRPGTGTDVAVGTIVGRASCRRLGEELGSPVDPRRFRMLLELDGLEPHAEDAWEGLRVRVGDAVVVGGGPVPRCAVTTQDPDTGIVTLDTLRGIRAYRGRRDGEWLDFGVYFDVVEPGVVRVGDEVAPL
jgi:uncharacterized protein YcbX